jgi:hypothetical protein
VCQLREPRGRHHVRKRAGKHVERHRELAEQVNLDGRRENATNRAIVLLCVLQDCELSWSQLALRRVVDVLVRGGSASVRRF